MRCLARNKSEIWYADFSEKTELRDENGHRTGQYRVGYSKPKMLMANVSAAKGETATRQFGDEETYDKVVVIADPKTAITENSVLWVEITPSRNRDGTLVLNADGSIATPHDYIVHRVARGLNNASVAIRKVKISG